MGSPEQELLAKLAPRIQNEEVALVSEDDILERMNQHFPFVGSKVDWDQLEDTGHWTNDAGNARSILTEVFNNYRVEQGSKLFVVGDSAMGSALSTDAESLLMFIEDVVELPQHTYVVPPDMGWVLCFSMEGFIDAGRKQRD